MKLCVVLMLTPVSGTSFACHRDIIKHRREENTEGVNEEEVEVESRVYKGHFLLPSGKLGTLV